MNTLHDEAERWTRNCTAVMLVNYTQVKFMHEHEGCSRFRIAGWTWHFERNCTGSVHLGLEENLEGCRLAPEIFRTDLDEKGHPVNNCSILLNLWSPIQGTDLTHEEEMTSWSSSAHGNYSQISL